MSGKEEHTTTHLFGPRANNRLAMMGIRFANEGGDGSGAGSNTGTDNYTPPQSQADLDRIISERLGRERAAAQERFKDFDTFKSKAEQFDQIKASGNTNQDPALAARLAEFETRVTAAETTATALKEDLTGTKLELARKDVLLDKGLAKDDLVLLTGTTKEELEAAADRVLALKNATSSGRVPGQGQRDSTVTTGGSVDAGRDLFDKRRK